MPPLILAILQDATKCTPNHLISKPINGSTQVRFLLFSCQEGFSTISINLLTSTISFYNLFSYYMFSFVFIFINYFVSFPSYFSLLLYLSLSLTLSLYIDVWIFIILYISSPFSVCSISHSIFCLLHYFCIFIISSFVSFLQLCNDYFSFLSTFSDCFIPLLSLSSPLSLFLSNPLSFSYSLIPSHYYLLPLSLCLSLKLPPSHIPPEVLLPQHVCAVRRQRVPTLCHLIPQPLISSQGRKREIQLP